MTQKINHNDMYEFCKLNAIDSKAASWLFENCPERLYPFLEYLAEEDYPRRGIKFNARKVFRELLEVHSPELPVIDFLMLTKN